MTGMFGVENESKIFQAFNTGFVIGKCYCISQFLMNSETVCRAMHFKHTLHHLYRTPKVCGWALGEIMTVDVAGHI